MGMGVKAHNSMEYRQTHYVDIKDQFMRILNVTYIYILTYIF